MHQLTICKTPKTRGGIQKRNHTARKKHIYATCTPPMATSINSTRVHQRCHPCKNQRHKGNVWERKERAAAQLLAAVRRFPELSGRSRAAWRRRPARGCSCRSRGRWRLRGSALPEGLQPAAHVAFRSLLPKRKMRSAATWERRSPAPRAHPSSGARVPTSLGALRGHRHRDREPPSAAASPARSPPEETRGLPNSGCRPLPTLPSSVSPLPIPAGPLGTSPAARPERGSARPLRGCAAAASRRLPPQPRPPGRRGGRCRQPPASRPPAAQPLRSRSIPAAERRPSPPRLGILPRSRSTVPRHHPSPRRARGSSSRCTTGEVKRILPKAEPRFAA